MIERIQIIHGDFSDSLKEMSFESVGRVFMALIAYANDEDPSEILGDDKEAKIMYLAIKGQMSRAEDYRLKRVGNGKKGGAPFGNSNARKTTENNQKQPKTTKNKLQVQVQVHVQVHLKDYMASARTFFSPMKNIRRSKTRDSKG